MTAQKYNKKKSAMLVTSKADPRLNSVTRPSIVFNGWFPKISLCIFSIGLIVFMFSYFSTTDVVRAAEVHVTAQNSKPILELHIADNGMIFLQGATVVSVLDKTLILSAQWHQLDFKWVVETNESYYGVRHFGTTFLDTHGKPISIADIRPGDSITVSGRLDTNQTKPMIKADTIRLRN